jgi:DNA polymerase-3 subunit gamma/tau
MAHQAIARKWRPRLFEEIVGQTHVTRTLQNAIRLGRIHHAFLLTGARGVGKTSAARILARALNCEQGPTENPCNECSACTEMLAGTYPDLLEIDAASHNSVDDIRDLVEKVRYAPQRGRLKVYVIDEVHMVSKAGFNALLKTLEEPPPHVIFILATTDPQQLLDTVVSRCQRFDFKMIPVRTVYERLRFIAEQEGVSVPDSSLMVIAREGGGSMRDAQSLLDQVLSFSGESVTEDEVAEILGFIDRSILYEVLEGALQGNTAGAIEALGKVALFGYDVRTFAEQLLEAVRNVHVVLQIRDGGDLLDLPDDEINRLQTLAEGQASETLQRHFEVLANGVDKLHRSEQPLLLLEMAVVKMASIRPFVPVQDMIDRLEALERRIRKAGLSSPASGGPARPTDGRGASQPPRPAAATTSSAPAFSPPAFSPPAFSPPAAPEAKSTPKAAPKTTNPPPSAPEEIGSVADMLFGFEASSSGTTAATPAVAEIAAATAAPEVTVPEVITAAPDAPEVASPEVAPSAPPAEAPPVAVADPAPKSPTEVAAEAPPSQATAAQETEIGTASVVALPQRDMETRGPDKSGPKNERIELAEDRPDPPGTALCDATRWRRFVHQFGQQKGMGVVCAPLAIAGFIGTEGQSISIGFASSLPMRQMEEVCGLAVLQTALHESFGEGTSLCWIMDREGVSGRSLVEELRLQRAEQRAELEERAVGSEAVALVQEVFPGSKIADVFLPDTLEITHVR